MGKGDDTRQAVLHEALAQASHVGLKGISIGGLADATGMSKSGLFAHFRSKEQLQIEVLDFAGQILVRQVLSPALAQPRGEKRLRTLFERWLGWDGFADFALPGGCVFITAAREYDDEADGPVRRHVVRIHEDWIDSVSRIFRTAIDEGDLGDAADPVTLAHELSGIMLGYHFQARLLRDPAATDRTNAAFERLLADARA